MQTLGEYSESATRIAMFEKVQNRLAKDRGGQAEYGDLVTAAFESRDLMDFARFGKATRDWNVFTAFANANIQGFDKFCRTFDLKKARSKDKSERQEWQRAMTRLMLTAIPATLLFFFINKDNDWYKEDLQDWERQSHWIVGEHIRIPKGPDIGVRFVSNFLESFLRYAYKQDPKSFDNVMKPLIDSAPDWAPTALMPIFECAMNYDMFRGKPIVPYYQEKTLPAHMQYDSRTSNLAKFIGEKANVSPKKVDHFLYGYTANLGRSSLHFLETVGSLTFGDKKANQLNFEASDIPLFGGLFRVPYQNPKIVTEYYNTLDEQTKLYNEYKMTRKEPKGFDKALYKRLDANRELMSKIAKAEHAL